MTGSPVFRFLLLNQTAISQLQQFNVTSQLEQNLTINWVALPADVQSFLLLEKQQNILANLTFSEWGWTESDQQFAATSLISLLTTRGQVALSQINTLIASINFNTVVNTTLLVRKRGDRPPKAVNNFVENAQEIVEFNQMRMKRHLNKPRVPTAFDVIANAQKRASRVIKRNAAGNGINMHHFD